MTMNKPKKTVARKSRGPYPYSPLNTEDFYQEIERRGQERGPDR